MIVVVCPSYIWIIFYLKYLSSRIYAPDIIDCGGLSLLDCGGYTCYLYSFPVCVFLALSSFCCHGFSRLWFIQASSLRIIGWHQKWKLNLSLYLQHPVCCNISFCLIVWGVPRQYHFGGVWIFFLDLCIMNDFIPFTLFCNHIKLLLYFSKMHMVAHVGSPSSAGITLKSPVVVWIHLYLPLLLIRLIAAHLKARFVIWYAQSSNTQRVCQEAIPHVRTQLIVLSTVSYSHSWILSGIYQCALFYGSHSALMWDNMKFWSRELMHVMML